MRQAFNHQSNVIIKAKLHIITIRRDTDILTSAVCMCHVSRILTHQYTCIIRLTA